MENNIIGRRIYTLLLVVVLLSIFGFSAESAARDATHVPPNAHLDPHKRHWECNRGYRKNGAACVRVDVPENAYLNRFGHD